LADVYDALISRRVYKTAKTHEDAMAIMLEARATHFDPDVIDAFCAIHEEFRQIAADFADGEREVTLEALRMHDALGRDASEL
jgi:putative two-component system response regulator